MSRVEDNVLNIPGMKELSLSESVKVLTEIVLQMRQELTDLQEALACEGVKNEKQD